MTCYTAHPSCFSRALGQLLLKGALKNLLQAWGDGAAKEPAEHGEVCRHMHSLHIDPHLNPESYSLQPNLIAISGPLHAPDQGTKATFNLVDGVLQASASLIERLPVLYRERHERHSL